MLIKGAIRSEYPRTAEIFKKALVIVSSGIDGYVGGAVCVKMLQEIFGFNISNIDVVNREYHDPFEGIEKYNFAIVADLPITNKKDADKLIKYNEDRAHVLFWFDHHQTSLNMSDEYPKLKDIYGIRSVDGAGAMLVWLFYDMLKNGGVIKTPINVKDMMIRPNAPMVVLWADDYNRGLYKIRLSVPFVRAFESCPDFPKDCKSNKLHDLIFGNDVVEKFKFTSYGININHINMLMSMSEIKEGAFIASLDKVPNIKMLCCNTSFKSNLYFGYLLEKYNYICVYTQKENECEANIYMYKKFGTKPTADEICFRYGGGGNIEAAEFVTSSLRLVDHQPLPEEDIKILDNKIMELLNTMK